jgi:molybdopterin-guanine dinucleotide biosynthesis protein MobB
VNKNGLQMHQIVSIVGKSGSGKTTLLERLIIELSGRGYRVGIVKHSHHDNDLDTAKKDTWRFTKAGSAFSAINSLDNLAIYRRADNFFDPREISDFVLWDYDIILTEGFKGSPYPKIEVHNPAQGNNLLTDPALLMAVVSDEPLDNIEVPRYTRDEIRKIADIIEEKFRQNNGKDTINLVVNGKPVELSTEDEEKLRTMLLDTVTEDGTGRDIESMHVSLRRKL